MPPLEDDAANESEDEDYGKEANGGDKPSFRDQPRHTARWRSLRRKGKRWVRQMRLVEKRRFNFQTDWLRKWSHTGSVEGSQANRVNDGLGEIAQQERCCRWLEGKVGDEAVVREDLNLEACQLPIQIGLAGTPPVGNCCSGIQKLELDLSGRALRHVLLRCEGSQVARPCQPGQ